ncbi:RloB family protein [Corynebacterium sp. HMSC071B10]|uniref:RloB family protein n=1 Tax=Corynebacterium sp. HMSC071B10 TaxID=1739494 RepID=UPI0009F59D48|nr:RloB family protein [Corynebacterium sp. HMSC071B10]
MGRMNKFSRNKDRAGTKSLRSLFLIIVEGETEKAYFENFRGPNIRLTVRSGKGPDPNSLVKEMDRQLEQLRSQRALRPKIDQAWIVLDRDNSSVEQLEVAFDWAEPRVDRGVGYSCPQFEYWLLLHFEDAHGVSTQQDCLTRINRHIPQYQKGNSRMLRFSRDQIQKAVERANRRLPEVPKSIHELHEKMGHTTSLTTLHPLVADLLKNTR